MSQEYEAERAVSRDDVATALRRLADGVAAGSVSVAAESGTVAVDVPADLTFEVVLVVSDDDVELEVEREWETADGPAVRELDQDAGSATGTEAASDADAEAATGADADTATESAAGTAADLAALVGPATDPAAPTAEAESKATFELFRDAADEWRWRLRHRNGNVIADSGEGYDRKAGAVNGVESVKSNAPHAVVEER
jgi:amphi-Trp domain-containing protein